MAAGVHAADVRSPSIGTHGGDVYSIEYSIADCPAGAMRPGRPRRRGGLTRLRLHCGCLPARMATEQAARMAKQDRDQKRQQAKTIDYME